MKSTITTLGALALIATLAACGQTTPPTTGPDAGPNLVSTPLTGRLYAGLRGQARRIEVVDLLDGVVGPVRCETMSDREGKWSCDLQALYGDFLVKVDTGVGASLQAVVEDVEQGKSRSVVVSPFTHLTAAYLEARLGRGEPLDIALSNARRLVHGHFGGIAHHRVNPDDAASSLSGVLNDSLVAGFLWVGMQALAADIAVSNGQGTGGSIDVWALLGAVAADVRADGVFDGQGLQGVLRLGETALDGDTLRTDLGRSLLDWMDSEANTTNFLRRDLEALAMRIASNTSELFPADVPDPLDNQPPMIVSLTVGADPLAPLAEGSPIAGTVYVTVEASDPSGLAAFALVESTGADVVGPGMALGHAGHQWQVDGTALADGTHTFEVQVTDGANNRATQTIDLVVDNTPPVLTVAAAGRSQTSTVGVTGEVTDAIGPVARVSVSVVGQPAIVIEDPPQIWQATAQISCDGSDYTVEVRAEDAAGNEVSTLVEVGCDDSAPSLLVRRTEFFDGDQTIATFDVATQDIIYTAVDFPTPTAVASEGPHQFVKYFTRLDDVSPNLPVLGVTSADDRGDAQLIVEYRYVVDGQLVRDWSAAETTDRFDWSVPVSYQHLGTELATAGSSANHVVDIRARDAAGNASTVQFAFTMSLRSPPLWFGGCAIDPTLQGHSLAGQNLHEVYTSRDTAAVQGGLHYELGVPRSSLTPNAGVRVRPTTVDIRSHINTLRVDVHDGPVDLNVQFPGPLFRTWACVLQTEYRLWEGAAGQGVDLGCLPGPVPLEGLVRRERSVDGPLNEARAHDYTIAMTRPGGTVLSDGQQRYLLDDGIRHAVLVGMLEPEVRIAGQAYDWSTVVRRPAGYFVNNAPPRYRGFTSLDGEVGLMPGLTGEPGLQKAVTRAFISDFEIDVAPVTWDVTHEELDVQVPVQVAPECAMPLIYRTAL